MDDTGTGLRTFFWIWLIGGGGFILFQLYAWITHKAVPVLNRYGSRVLEAAPHGQVNPQAHSDIGWFLVLEVAIWLVILLALYMRTYYSRGSY